MTIKEYLGIPVQAHMLLKGRISGEGLGANLAGHPTVGLWVFLSSVFYQFAVLSKRLPTVRSTTNVSLLSC